MEVSNRFSLLGSLLVDEEATESPRHAQSTIEENQQIDAEPADSNAWDIPKYVERRIPSSSPVSMQEPTARINVNVVVTRERREKVHKRPAIPVQLPPSVLSVCLAPPPPPHPYKFKASLSSELSADSHGWQEQVVRSDF